MLSMLNMILLFIGTTELIVIAGVALLIFGGKKLPELMRGLGKGVKEFKEGVNGSDSSMPQKETPSEHVTENASENPSSDK